MQVAIDGVISGRLSRREFVRRAGILGLSTTTVASVLAACGSSGSASSTAPSATSGSVAGSTAAAAGWDPKKYAGTTLNIIMTGDENDSHALTDMLPQLEQETGIKLQVTAPSLTPLISKTLQNLKAGRSAFELVEYLGFLTTQQVGGGYFEKLNPYIENKAETPPDWDFGDFLPGAMKNVGIYDLAAKKLGQGNDVYGIPGLHSGSVIYFYRKDLFDKAGLQPAKTWDEFKAAAQKLNSPGVAGCSFIGANDFSLATVSWYTTFITTGGVLMSGSPTDKTFKPAVNSPQGIAALQYLIDLKPYAPKNVTTYGFAENVDGFSSGKIAQMIFWSTIAGPVIDPAKSKVAGSTGTAAVPTGPGQKPQAIQGGWGVGIPKNADPAKKAAAWRALTWITNKPFNKYEEQKYQIDANRTSTFQDSDLVKQLPYLPASLAAIQDAHIIETSVVDEFFQLNTIMNVEFNKALIGGQSASAACNTVQQQWETLLRQSGHLA